MTLQKISKIIVAILGVAGIIALVTIISTGDDAIKDLAAQGDTSPIDPIYAIGLITLVAIVVLVVFFVLKNLFTNTKSLKGTLIGVGAFALVLLVSYGISVGADESFKEGLYKSGDTMATEGESKMVGAGLIAFYALLAIAAVSMIFSGVKKVISK